MKDKYTMIQKFRILNNEKKAILATNFYNFETLKGVLLAAKETNSGIILQLTQSSIDYMGLENALEMARTALKYYNVEAWIHLDHGGTVSLAKQCIEAGFDSVMYDGSELPLKKNIENTREVVEYAQKYNVNVEAELGYVAKLGQDTNKTGYTEVNDAVKFVRETGINTLAVAIGTAHGFYKEKPKLDFNRLNEIKQAIKIPLVLHGGSGVPDADLIKAVDNGINKINVATEIKNTFIQSIKKEIANTDEIDLRKIFPPAIQSVTELIKHKLTIIN
jgi:fructose-bisphosphate aldolase class II/tagatose 1,6-diphosphate aldolase GatY/KbaY